jgi:tRNA A37 methylthiotransferase MiaB
MDVLIEEDLGDGRYLGRGPHQAPEVDGTVEVTAAGAAAGDLLRVRITDSDGVDLAGVPAAASASQPADAAPAPAAGVLAAGPH